MQPIRYPLMEVDLAAIEQNAKAITGMCARYGIGVAGVIKFSDGRVPIAKAYAAGGCKQIAVARAKHLQEIKTALPEHETLLTRAPAATDLEDAARWGDIILHSDADGLRALADAAEKTDARPGVILMLDVGDLREGVDSIEELTALARLVERDLPRLRLRGVGCAVACLNGVLPDWDNLSFLASGADAVEQAIGRKLELVSGGSSINLRLLVNGKNEMPPRINHLRIGGTIANPMNFRINRGIRLEGTREDTVRLKAQIIEIHEKESAPKNSTKNWAGLEIHREDKGRRLRAIAALGEQDIGEASMLLPLDEGVEIVGASSDHLILDVSDSPRAWRYGDVATFGVKYMAMLHGFTGSHVSVRYL